ncbi:hypothetical protein [Bradyrhizobium valentinum]|uniref:Uncharacterized protein n=1 Tax=Bradyrhizobium valentinum TaxID=1518501 RepID=A0A0R3M2L4_9BRAD|nr:hypothetical protein [Bradyrhizobium valentinum]KRR14530.1 hypothetical protein CP49_25805 [Bradyrhizobium valentinum]
MNKLPAPPKSSEVVLLKPLPFFRALDRLIDDADGIVRQYDKMERLISALSDGRKVDLAACRRAATISTYDEERLARCREGLDKFDPESAYEDNDREFGDLRQSVIAEQIALLIDSKPTGRPPNPECYTTMMMEDLRAVEGLSLIALTTACREVRQAKPYVPDISDLMPVLRRHLQAWEERQWAIFRLADESRSLMESIEATELEAQQAAKKHQQAEKMRAVEYARRKLEQARRALSDAEDWCREARTILREREEEYTEREHRVLECENELARAEVALRYGQKDDE